MPLPLWMVKPACYRAVAYRTWVDEGEIRVLPDHRVVPFGIGGENPAAHLLGHHDFSYLVC